MQRLYGRGCAGERDAKTCCCRRSSCCHGPISRASVTDRQHSSILARCCTASRGTPRPCQLRLCGDHALRKLVAEAGKGPHQVVPGPAHMQQGNREAVMSPCRIFPPFKTEQLHRLQRQSVAASIHCDDHSAVMAWPAAQGQLPKGRMCVCMGSCPRSACVCAGLQVQRCADPLDQCPQHPAAHLTCPMRRRMPRKSVLYSALISCQNSPVS